MPKIRFTQNIQRHVSCPEESVTGKDVRTALESYFAKHPNARGYVLDDQGGLRKHMAIFINNQPIMNRNQLDDPVSPEDTMDIIQALSGG